MVKKYSVMSSERLSKLLRSLKAIESKGNAGRARAKRMERAVLSQYAGVAICGGRCVVPFPFAE